LLKLRGTEGRGEKGGILLFFGHELHELLEVGFTELLEDGNEGIRCDNLIEMSDYFGVLLVAHCCYILD
jgi:hypothetical protein